VEKLHCKNCNGHGYFDTIKCPLCKGSGWYWRQYQTVFKITKIADMTKIELVGIFLSGTDKLPPIWDRNAYYIFFNTPLEEVISHTVYDLIGSDAEIPFLRQKVKDLKKEITIKDQSLHEKNVALDAMHYVWCDGGCGGGTHRFTEDDLTEEIVKAAESNTARLRRWWNNRRK